MRTDRASPKEGDLYKAFAVAGHPFELRYGYYDEQERPHCPPVVIFPDLLAAPLYHSDGHPLVTQIQEPCEHFVTAKDREEDWCGDCIHFSSEHREIGICLCDHRKRTTLEKEETK